MNKSCLLVFLSSCFLSIFSITCLAQSYDFNQDTFSAIEGVSIAEQKIFVLVNEERKKAGLPELFYDVSLQSAARQHSQEMLKLDYFSHLSPTGGLKNPSDRVYRSGLSDYVVGENIAVHSLDVSAEKVAEQLMEQWMNSPGHRANILRPEFTHIGIGVISFKDSTVKDTVIKGAHGRLVVYTIRHYGTQVFTSRSISFSKLELVKSETEFLVFDLQFEYDRSTLASFNNYSQFFKPSGNKMSMHVEIPVQPSVKIYLAHIQNDYTKEYLSFFQDEFIYENVVKTLDKLSGIPFPIINKDIKIKKKQSFFLEGEGTLVSQDPQIQCLLNIDSDRYYELEIAQNKLRFRIPIDQDGTTKKISLAIGNGRQKLVTNVLMIDTAVLDKNGSPGNVFIKN